MHRRLPCLLALVLTLAAAAPAAAAAPGAPGAPTTGTTVTRGVFTLAWTPATDPDGDTLTYAVDHRDADDAGWSRVASGLAATSFSFTDARPERSGTFRFRVRATDGAGTTGPWSADSAKVVSDRGRPATPALRFDRAPEWTAGTGVPWFRDQVTAYVVATTDPALGDGSPGAGFDAASAPAPRTLGATGPTTVTGTVADRAGNVSPVRTHAVAVDAVAPVLDLAATTPGGAYAGGWTAAEVTVAASCADEASGSGVAFVTGPQTPGAELVAEPRAATCRDRVGHEVAAQTAPLSIDRIAPFVEVACPSQPVAAGAAARATWTASDHLSGVDGPAAGEVVLDTSAPGTHTAAASVRDRAGNLRAATCGYVVEGGAASAPAPAGTAQVVGPRRVRATRGGRLRLRLACPRDAAAACSTAIVAKGASGRVAARPVRAVAAAVRPGATRTVTLALGRWARAALRRSGRLRVVTGTGARRVTLRVLAPR